MSDEMRPVPFGELIERIFEEYAAAGSIFELPRESWYRKADARSYSIFGESCETPLGPAAGPHSQLAQNIVAAYLSGGRFIELKTVQILESLQIEKPCIDAADEGYNTEWSTELSLDAAWEEYAKAWILLHLIEFLFDLKATSASRSFAFNMSVGYDLEGIRSDPMQRFISRMKDSSSEPDFSRWISEALAKVPALLPSAGLEDKSGELDALETTISREMCTQVTLSTMHGCPPDEIEAICDHMLTRQGLDTYVKLNPTLLGFDTVCSILGDLGFTYVALDRAGFEHDLCYDDAIALIDR